MKRSYWLALVFFTQVSFAQHLLKDITDESTLDYNGSLFNMNGAKFNGRYYFVAQSLENGFEVFYTDGTAAGTSMLKEIVPGEKGIGTQVGFGATSDFLLFGFEGEDGNQLWRSDGTGGGTKMIAAVKPYIPGWPMVELDGVLYFVGFDDQHGVELWRSDGTTEGTFIVKDITPGAGGSIANLLTIADNRLFFVANDNVHGAELWISDGTAAGTTMVSDLHAGNNLAFYTNITAVGNKAYFIDGRQVWKSDGTEAGTVSLTNFPDGDALMNEQMAVINNKLLFRHSTNTEGMEMYALDLTTEQAGLLKESIPGAYPAWNNIINATPVTMNGMAWFFAEHDNNKYSIWKTDGTSGNTELAFDLHNLVGQQWPQQLLATSNVLFFTLSDSYFKATDGVSEPILLSRRAVNFAAELNDKIILNAGEPWISDGTVDGTHLIKQINTARNYPSRTIANTNTGFVFAVNGYKPGYTSYSDIWSSDGTTTGTSLLQSFLNAFSGDVAVNGDKFLFGAVDAGSSPYSIWIGDGTQAGTKQLKDGNWYTYSGQARLKWIGNTALIFSGTELWKTDGTSPGTVKIKTLPTQYAGNSPVSFKNSLYFFIRHQLWKSDGTEPGTVMVKNLDAAQGAYGQFLTAGTNKIYFVAWDVDHGWEVWVSDGTADGTHFVKDVSPTQSQSYLPIIRAVINDVAYFVEEASTGDTELWRTDGTEAGTRMVKDIFEGPKGSRPNILATTGNTLYFTANDGIHGYEFWKTDGTSEGTVMLKDIYPGMFSSIWSNQCAVQVINGVMYFSAIDDTHGYELWKTDGTEAGTQLVYDVNPGILSGVSTGTGSMTSVGNRLIFTANDGVHGYEFWEYLTMKNGQTISFTPIPGKKLTDAPFQLMATASSGLPVTFEVVSGPATISGSTLTITGIGSVTVRATQAGNSDYNPISIEQTFTVDLFDALEDETAGINIFPNPASTTIIVNAPSFKTTSIKDLVGRDVITTNISGDNTTIDVSHLPRGMYVVRLEGGDQKSITRKIILN